MVRRLTYETSTTPLYDRIVNYLKIVENDDEVSKLIIQTGM